MSHRVANCSRVANECANGSSIIGDGEPHGRGLASAGEADAGHARDSHQLYCEWYARWAHNVTETLGLALDASGCDDVTVVHEPRLLSGNGSSYVAGDLADFLKDKGMDHVRGAPHHPRSSG